MFLRLRNLISQLKLNILKDKEIVFKVLSTGLARGFSAAGTLFFHFILARSLGVGDFGSFMMAYSIIVGLGFITRFGMPFAIIRFVGIMYHDSKFGEIKKIRQDSIFFNLFNSLIASILLILFRHEISNIFFKNTNIENILFLFALALPFYSFQTIQSSFFKAIKLPQIAPYFESGLTLILTGLAFGLFTILKIDTGSSLELASIVFVSSSIFVVLFGFLILDRHLRQIDGYKNSKMQAYSGFYKTLPDYAISAITSYLLRYSPSLLLGIYATNIDIGLYSAANSTAFILSFVLWIVSTVYAPYFASFYKNNRLHELRTLVINSTLYMMIIALPLYFIIVIFPKFILSLFGDSFVDARYGLIIIATAYLFNIITGPLAFLLGMTGFEKQLRNITLLTAFLTLSTSFILIPQFTFMGAVISTSIGLVFQNSISLYLVNKHLGLKILKRW